LGNTVLKGTGHIEGVFWVMGKFESVSSSLNPNNLEFNPYFAVNAQFYDDILFSKAAIAVLGHFTGDTQGSLSILEKFRTALLLFCVSNECIRSVFSG
jgi:hypothetical protein